MNRNITDEWFYSEGEDPVHELVIEEYPYDEWWPLDQTLEHHIYFIIEGVNGAIKIGRTRKLGERIASLQTGNSKKLRLLAFTIEYGEMSETNLHLIFDEHHIHGEWFTPAPEILDFIARIRWNQKSEISFESLYAHASLLYNQKITQGVAIKP